MVSVQYSNYNYACHLVYRVTWNKSTKSGALDMTCSNSVYVSLCVLAMSDSCITPSAMKDSSSGVTLSPVHTIISYTLVT